MSPSIQRALISVSDKTGLLDFAKSLAARGIEIYSTGGTARHLTDGGLSVTDVAEYTGFPEMMDGRLKTLHPKIFGGLLCRHDREDDMRGIAEHQIVPFELVVVNLYPFSQTIARPDVSWSEAIENIDIGGPSLVRAAAKNHAFVAVATVPAQYQQIIESLDDNNLLPMALRQELAAAAFAHTARYDAAIAGYFAEKALTTPTEPTTPHETAQTDIASQGLSFPAVLSPEYQLKTTLRYGENPHQLAAVYTRDAATSTSLLTARQLNGKELSYNNLLDADAALQIARSLPDAAVSVVKHNNPCGAASAETIEQATQRAMEGDPVSAFGSILGFNQTVNSAAAKYLSTPGLFIEAIVAPDFSEAAIEILTTRPKWKSNVRLLATGPLEPQPIQLQSREIAGGLLVQESDTLPDEPDAWKVVTETQPTPASLSELKFAWAVVRHIKSNAIVLCRDRAVVGVGAGQMSRVDSVQIAIRKAAERTSNSVLASDAFFPFADSIHEAASAGVRAIIQPGGSKRDDEVIAACNERNVAMLFTSRRHFKH